MKAYNGTIVTCDPEGNTRQWLVEDKGKIIFCGDNLPEDLWHKLKPDDITTLRERALLPAFGDGHMHFSNWAFLAVSQFDVRKAETIPNIQKMISNHLKSRRPGKVVIGFGASKHSVKEQRLITRQELDEVCPDIPMLLIAYDGHSAIFNTPLMNKFPENVKALRGYRENEGHLFNESYFKGTDFATAMVSPLTMVKSIIKSYDLLAEKGISMIHAVEGIGFAGDLDVTLVALAGRARNRRHGFATRLFFQTRDVKKVLKRNLPRVGGCFDTALDGCFGVKDAALHEPYSDDPENTGILFQTEDEIFSFAKEANRNGLQIQFHAIGDAAVSRAVAAIRGALEDTPRKDHRHTIIHACLITPEDMREIARLGIHITLQPAFLTSPLEPLSYLKKILGDRVKTSSPLRTMTDMGIPVSGGSDAPVVYPDPIAGIHSACNHPYDPAQSLTIQEAVNMFTINVARGAFDEEDRGSLEEGKRADMVILNTNPLTTDTKELKSLKVEQLILQGEPYRRSMGIPGMLINGFTGGKNLI